MALFPCNVGNGGTSIGNIQGFDRWNGYISSSHRDDCSGGTRLFAISDETKKTLVSKYSGGTLYAYYTDGSRITLPANGTTNLTKQLSYVQWSNTIVTGTGSSSVTVETLILK